jgi:hypothetical protein
VSHNPPSATTLGLFIQRRGHVNQWHKRHMPSKTTSEKSSMMHNEMFNAMPNKWVGLQQASFATIVVVLQLIELNLFNLQLRASRNHNHKIVRFGSALV